MTRERDDAPTRAEQQRDDATARAERAEQQRDEARARAELADGARAELQRELGEVTRERDSLRAELSRVRHAQAVDAAAGKPPPLPRGMRHAPPPPLPVHTFQAVYACATGHEADTSGRCGCGLSRDLVRWDARRT